MEKIEKGEKIEKIEKGEKIEGLEKKKIPRWSGISG
jgi:hypothetical protein